MISTRSSRSLDNRPPQSRNATPSGRGGDANIIALLSLKLMLLAFFLLLVSMSSLQEQKVMLVIESVNDVFDGKIKATRSFPVFESALEELEGARDPRHEIARLFEQYLPASRVEPLDQGDKLRIALDLKLFFAEGESAFLVGPGLLLDRLAALLRRSAVLEGTRVLAQQGLPASDQRGAEDLNLAADRMAVLAQAFVKRGLAPERISAGLGDVPPGQLWIVIENIYGNDPKD